jgi:CRP-like cAMP-binding protein
MALFGERRSFLSRLAPADRGALLALGVERVFEPGAVLLREGDGGSFLVVLLVGWCAVWLPTERGGRVILGLRGGGELVGELAALDPHPRSATVGALGRVRVVVVPGERFRRYVAERPAVAALVLAQLADRLRGADHERRALASFTVLRRLCVRLVELADRTGTGVAGGGDAAVGGGAAARAAAEGAGVAGGGGVGGGPVAIRLPLPQSDLAAAIGATREAVAKALRLLREQGLVRTGPGTLVVLEIEPLRLLAAGE